MPRYENILETIGNTPIVRLNRLAPEGVNVFVKIESFNPLGTAPMAGSGPAILVPVADAHASVEGEGDPRGEHDVVDLGRDRLEAFALAETDRRRLGVDRGDERGLAERDAEPFSLADREAVNPFVRADDLAARVDDGPRTDPRGRA